MPGTRCLSFVIVAVGLAVILTAMFRVPPLSPNHTCGSRMQLLDSAVAATGSNDSGLAAAQSSSDMTTTGTSGTIHSDSGPAAQTSPLEDELPEFDESQLRGFKYFQHNNQVAITAITFRYVQWYKRRLLSALVPMYVEPACEVTCVCSN